MSDKIIRLTAAGAAIRVFVADTRETVQTAFDKHKTSPVMTAALGRTLTAAAMMGVMQKNDTDLLTIQIDGDGPAGKITVTANAKGEVKGFANEPLVLIPLKSNGKLDVSGAIGRGTLTVIKDLGLKEPYTGTIELVSGEIAEDITYYFMASEQVPSSVGLGVLVDTDYSVKQAGGFIVQLMPFAEDSVIDRLEANLSSISSVTTMFEEGMSLMDIAHKILEGFDIEVVGESQPAFKCNCSRERVHNALSTLNKNEIKSMIADGDSINVHCDFCNTDYEFTIEQLKDILEN